MSEGIPPEVETVLTSEPTVAYLATCVDNRPHVAPVWYRLEAGLIEIMTTGQKLANIRQNPRVALSVQKDEHGHPEWVVNLRGRATPIEDQGLTREQNAKLNRKYDADEDSWSENTLVRVEIGSVSYRTY